MASIRQFNYTAKKRNNKDKTEIETKCPSCSLTITVDKDIYPREKCTEDRRLLTWNKWSEIRKKECNHLAKKTLRQPVDLVMNLVETVREDKERKMAIEHAQVQNKASIRNGLWEQPLRLKQPCPCKPVYEVQRTAVEKGRPQQIEHVGVPKIVLHNEKGIFGVTERPSCDNLNLEYNLYRNQREKELKSNIDKIVPFKPTVDNLVVMGNKPRDTKNKIPALPSIVINSDPELARDQLTGVYAIKINEAIFFKEQVGQHLKHIRAMKALCKDKCIKWTYYFKAPVKGVCRSKLILENLGTVSLRFCWKKIVHPVPFIPESLQEQVFFFNKNEDIISPGQSKNIIFSFLFDKPGIFSESWELNFCNINFLDSELEKFVIELHADVSEDIENIKKMVKGVKRMIMQKVKFNMARCIIDKLITKSTTVEPQCYPYKNFLLEGDIFVMKNPICFYHQTEVDKLRCLYKEMQPNVEWDLSLGSWRKAMMMKDFDTRMMLYENLKKSYVQLLKPWREGDELPLRKHRAVYEVLGLLAHDFDRTFNSVTDKLISKTEKCKEQPRLDVLLSETIHMVFYMKIRDHISSAVEVCAGILSSMDQSREIDYDFCRQ